MILDTFGSSEQLRLTNTGTLRTQSLKSSIRWIPAVIQDAGVSTHMSTDIRRVAGGGCHWLSILSNIVQCWFIIWTQF